MHREDAAVLAPARGKSISTMVVPIGLVAIVVANTLYVGLSQGRKDEKLDTVVDSVKEIKTEMYRRSDAEKDREVVNVKLDGLERRVTILEAAREHHVAVVTARVEKQEDDLLTRAQHWLIGKPH
jgi:hypothetical protein